MDSFLLDEIFLALIECDIEGKTVVKDYSTFLFDEIRFVG